MKVGRRRSTQGSICTGFDDCLVLMPEVRRGRQRLVAAALRCRVGLAHSGSSGAGGLGVQSQNLSHGGVAFPVDRPPRQEQGRHMPIATAVVAALLALPFAASSAGASPPSLSVWDVKVVDADQGFRGLDAVDRHTAWVTGGSVSGIPDHRRWPDLAGRAPARERGPDVSRRRGERRRHRGRPRDR